MSEYAKCKWCGRSFEKKGWNKFLSHNTMGLAGKETYCSSKCEMEAQGAQGGGNNTIQSGGGMDNQPQVIYTPAPTVQPQDKWGNTVETISFRLNELNKNAQTAAKEKDAKARIVEEMEFGIMRLRSIGATTEADFFDKKLEVVKLIKKKWYES